MFANRDEAGKLLGEALLTRGFGADVLVLGIPRGGVVVAAGVARALGAPLGVVLAAKVGAPGNPEFAVGAVAADGEVVANPQVPLTAAEVRALSGPALAKIRREVARFAGGVKLPSAAGRTVIVVDDGLATGLTAIAAVDSLRRAGAAHIVLAVPVAAPDSLCTLAEHADEVEALEVPSGFAAVGQFYSVFGQTDDEQVEALLGELGG